MTEQTLAQVVGQIVDLLTPRSSEERARIVSAALTLLGEVAPKKVKQDQPDEESGSNEGEEESADFTLKGKATAWKKQNNLTANQLAQVFHVNGDSIDVIATMPGKNKKEQTLNAYVLCGVARMLSTGEPDFTDSEARKICTSAGCYDTSNHSATLKDRGNLFTGTKDSGWKLTAPGLKHGASLIKDLATSSE